MKTIKKEETKVITTEVYVSADGKEFNNKEHCLEWENSYRGTLELSWKKLVKKEICAVDYGIPYSNEDNECYIIIPKSLEEITLINAYISCVTCGNGNSLDATMINKSICLNFGYDRDWCDVYNVRDFIDKVLNRISETENFLTNGETKSE